MGHGQATDYGFLKLPASKIHIFARLEDVSQTIAQACHCLLHEELRSAGNEAEYIVR